MVDVSHKSLRRLKAFSLIEIMVTLVVLAIIAVLAVPNFRNFVQTNNITASANNLMGSLSLARSEAVKRNIPVSICASNSQVECTGVDWNNGWIVFTDGPTDGAVDGGDEILSAVRGLPGGMEMMSSEPFIQFKPNGALAVCENCSQQTRTVQIAVNENMTDDMWLFALLYSALPGKNAWAVAPQQHQFQHQYGKNRGGGSPNMPGPNSTTPPAANTAQQSLKLGTEFIFCDANQTGEKGQRIFISISGQITRSTITCN